MGDVTDRLGNLRVRWDVMAVADNNSKFRAQLSFIPVPVRSSQGTPPPNEPGKVMGGKCPGMYWYGYGYGEKAKNGV